jgi:hypothetical protein
MAAVRSSPQLAVRLVEIESRRQSNLTLDQKVAGALGQVKTAEAKYKLALDVQTAVILQFSALHQAKTPIPKALEQSLAKAMKDVQEAGAALQGKIATWSSLKQELAAGQAEVLSAQQQLAAETKGKVFSEARSVDSLDDAGSLTREQQIALLGAPVDANPIIAAARDHEKLKKSVQNLTTRSAARASSEVFAVQLQGANPEYQAKLVKDAAPLIKAMASRANQDPATAKNLLEALKETKGPARDELMGLIAKNLSGASSSPYFMLAGGGEAEFTKALGATLASGEGFELAASLATALQKGGRTELLGNVQEVTLEALQKLRGDFESKQRQADRLDARLDSFVKGWGPNLANDPKDASAAMQDAIAGFKKDHAKEYAARDAAAAKYLAAVDGLASLPRLDPGSDRVQLEKGLGEFMKGARNDTGAALELELGKLEGNLNRLFETEPGKAKLQKALDAQELRASAKKGAKPLEGEPDFWLSQLSAKVATANDTNTLRQNVQQFLSKGIARAALTTSDSYRAAKLSLLLKNNAGALGITETGIKEYEKTIGVFFKPDRSSQEVSAALESLGKPDKNMTRGNKILNGIGLMVALPATLESMAKFGDAGLATKLRTVADVTGFANQALNVLFDSKVLEKFATPLAAVGNAAQVAQGISALLEGQYVEGLSDTSMGLGGLMLAAGQLSSKIPGLQLVGVGLMIAGGIVGLFKKTDAEKLEEAAEADLKKFLTRSGLPGPVAEMFSDVAQRDGRNVGAFFAQAAARLGVSPKELFDHLANRLKDGGSLGDQAFIKDAIEMIKAMPLDKSGRYLEKKKDTDLFDTPEMRGRIGLEGYAGPKSMDTALEYLRKGGLLPPGR